MIKNALSVDLESFIHRELNMDKRVEKDDGFIVRATDYLLDLFDKYDTKLTFFVLGEIYEWYPDLIEDIKKRGHEIGYHGHRHIIFENKEILLEDLRLSKDFLKKYKPIGFRAPRMFLKKEHLKILSDFGFEYDSSFYGSRIETVRDYNIIEIPVSLFNYFSNDRKNNFLGSMGKELLIKGIPYGSGLFISIFQTKIQYFIDFSNKNKISSNLFVHPWQFFDYKNINSLAFIQKILYKRKINKAIEYLLKKNRFFPLKNLM